MKFGVDVGSLVVNLYIGDKLKLTLQRGRG